MSTLRARKDILLLYGVYLLINVLGIVGGLLLVSQQHHPLEMTIGAGAVSSFIVSLLIGVYYLLQEVITTHQTNQALQAAEFGFRGYLPQRPFWQIARDAAFVEASHIDILEVSAHTISQHNEDQDWQQLMASTKRMRVLLLDPLYPARAPFAVARDEEEGRAGTQEIYTEVCEFLRKFGAGTSVDNFEVRLARCMPTISYFRWDRTVCWAPLLYGRDGHSVPHTMLRLPSPLGDELSRNFERIWTNARQPDGNLCSKDRRCKRHQRAAKLRGSSAGKAPATETEL
jgi:hypothetical protein